MSGITLPTPASYEFIVEPHRRALKTLELEWDFFIRDVRELNLFSVSSRIKQYDRAVMKASRLGIPVSELDDLAGLVAMNQTRCPHQHLKCVISGLVDVWPDLLRPVYT